MYQRKTLYSRFSHEFDEYGLITLFELKDQVCALIDQFGDTIKVDFNDGCVDLLLPRSETDDEMNKRIQHEEKMKIAQHESDMRQYEFYKKKLGL